MSDRVSRDFLQERSGFTALFQREIHLAKARLHPGHATAARGDEESRDQICRRVCGHLFVALQRFAERQESFGIFSSSSTSESASVLCVQARCLRLVASAGSAATICSLSAAARRNASNAPRLSIVRRKSPRAGSPRQAGDGSQCSDNWKDTQQEIEATTIPPSSDLESAIVSALLPAAYTAVVRGVNDTTGLAFVEASARLADGTDRNIFIPRGEHPSLWCCRHPCSTDG